MVHEWVEHMLDSLNVNPARGSGDASDISKDAAATMFRDHQDKSRVYLAWTDPGPAPWVHAAAKRTLLDTWPTLYYAIEEQVERERHGR